MMEGQSYFAGPASIFTVHAREGETVLCCCYEFAGDNPDCKIHAPKVLEGQKYLPAKVVVVVKEAEDAG